MASSRDSVLRAITDDGAFRVITASTTHTVADAMQCQRCTGNTARTFGELLTGAVVFRETMAPTMRVQCILKGAAGSGSLIADSHPSGDTRGLVQVAKGSDEVALGEGAALRMMRTLPSGNLHQGVVAVPDGGGVSEALMTYMQSSEQVATVIAVGTLLDDQGAVQVAGGYMVQLLPEVGRGPLMVMTQRLEDFGPLSKVLADEQFSPAALMEELLYGMPYTRLTQDDVRFGCWCSEVRVISSLATLPRSDIEDLVLQGEVLEISCDYCRKAYAVPPAQLRGMLEQS